MGPTAVRPFSPTQPLAAGTTLIEASAGTGKTWNIANLFVRLLAEAPTPRMAVDRILVVTFTEAATSELRDRIRTRLRAALTAMEAALPDGGPLPDDPVFAHLVDQGRVDGTLAERAGRLRTALECFDQSSISTIHGFCQRMLRLNAFESRVEFDQELVTDLRPYLEEVVQDFWVTETHDRWEVLVRHLQASHVLAGLRTLASRVCEDDELPVVPPIPDDEAEPDAGKTGWDLAVRRFRPDWESGRALAMQALLQAIVEGRMKPSAWTADDVAEAADSMDRWLAAGADPGAAMAWPLDRLRASAVAKAASVRKGVSRPPLHPLFERCEELAEARDGLSMHLAAWAEWLRRRFVGYARGQLARRKAELRVQSFQDLLRVLRDRLLGYDGIRLRDAIRSRYDAALIDEFQDTDPVQWDIFRVVFGHPEGRLYLIGDPKQAIYAFRHADVFAYLRAKAAAPSVYTLTENHRSDRPVLEVLNRLFARLDPLPFAFAPIPFDRVTSPNDAVRLRMPQGIPPPLRIRFVPGRPDDSPWSKEEADQRIPRLVARDILEFLASGAQVFDERREGEDKWRTVEPRDLAVLVRKNRQARAIQQALREAGIPGVVHGADSVLQTEEAEEIAFVLQAILAPARRTQVRTAISTRLMGGSANGIASLETDEASLDEWLELFHDLARAWEEHGFARMFRELLDRKGAMARVLAWPDGERRMTNFLHVAELLHRAEADEDHRPASLLGWLGRQIASPGGDADAAELRLETDADAVDIVTMHRCKGLEYRVVWCPYLWDNLAVGGADAQLVRFHDPDDDDRIKLDIGPDSDDKARHLEQAVFEARAENLRMMYVALTRARHQCTIFTGHISGVGASPVGWLLHRVAATDARQMFAATSDHVDGLGTDALLAEVRGVEGPGVEVGLATAPGRSGLLALPSSTVPDLEARSWSRSTALDVLWRRVSYSSLIKGDRAPVDGPRAEGQDREDASDATGMPGAAGSPRSRDVEEDISESRDSRPLLFGDLERGANTGDCLHAILEELDFQGTRQEWAPLVRKHLDRFGLDPLQVEPVCASLEEVVGSPLDGPGGRIRLRDVAMRDRRSEMKFDLPVADGPAGSGGSDAVGRQMLARPFRDFPGGHLPSGYAARIAALPFTAFRGFLTGFIDLVFRVGTRWYVVDYKSNHLGDTRGDYHADAMADEMFEANYLLQYHVYSVALHRFLGWRLQDYRYEDHFGGVFYLFLRGMPGDGAAGDIGVFRDLPPRARIESLSRLLGG